MIMAKYTNNSTGSAYGDKAKSDWERQQKKKGFDREAWEREQEENYGGWVNPNGQKKTKKSTIEAKEKAKTRNTIEAKEKAKTRSAIEAAFVGSSKSSRPTKEEQERMRKQGARNAANQYSWKYSGRRG
jgi:hypothetical protein